MTTKTTKNLAKYPHPYLWETVKVTAKYRREILAQYPTLTDWNNQPGDPS